MSFGLVSPRGNRRSVSRMWRHQGRRHARAVSRRRRADRARSDRLVSPPRAARRAVRDERARGGRDEAAERERRAKQSGLRPCKEEPRVRPRKEEPGPGLFQEAEVQQGQGQTTPKEGENEEQACTAQRSAVRIPGASSSF